MLSKQLSRHYLLFCRHEVDGDKQLRKGEERRDDGNRDEVEDEIEIDEEEEEEEEKHATACM